MLLFLAITIHNLPEGLAVGVAFGALATLGDGIDAMPVLMSAIGLTLGIGLQNMPEGAALSMPLRAEGKSRLSAFFIWKFFRDCRTYRGCHWCTICHQYDFYLTVCIGFCRGRYDFCGGRRTDP
ncbi:metal cation transporter, ZIP domain protein [Haemophilus pittmaniae HK 85]|uniref:Metal cation transporter, ZIP domain protein n=1 Tax=Haemophilus pittmaniae HK 85 TaxID=1035188 RepID=F9Q7J4_9PAST|nr:metal cation transporter, ZIP domain protein [Haemophilus pittmaniae HK 85]